jgi:hypothetical protein
MASVRARIEQALSPGVGRCYRCERPWRVEATTEYVRHDGVRVISGRGHDRYRGLVGVRYHVTRYSDGSGCFPLCVTCWERLTPTERLPYYLRLMRVWEQQGAPAEPDKREQITQAVLAGA